MCGQYNHKPFYEMNLLNGITLSNTKPTIYSGVNFNNLL